MNERVFNFSPGPAVLPLPVLEEAQKDLVCLPGVGMSILEISHRSKKFDEIIQTAESDLRKILGIPDNYSVLFLQGGATLQFSMVPMNFLPKDKKADYINTGSWATAAIKEAKKIGSVQVAASTEADKFSRVPTQAELRLDPSAAYVHYTSNETIGGVEWNSAPEVSVPLVCDSSSNFLSRPMDIKKHAIVYGGAQKNIGPAGVTIVIIRNDFLEKVPANLPVLMDYKVMANAKSLYNTPPVFCIYVVGLVLKWIQKLGGLEAMEKVNREKAKMLYDVIDASGGYYRGHAQAGSRSNMNVTFRMGSEELEAKFAKEATKAKLDGLKGHRSVGGLRASIYNAFPKNGVAALVDFMKDFQKKNG